MRPPERPLRVVLAGRPYDLSDARYDGFVDRRRPLIGALLQRHEVGVAVLRPAHDHASVMDDLRERVVCDQPLVIPVENRRSRMAYLVRLIARRDSWASEQHELLASVARADPDVVVTLGPWLEDVYSPLFARYPTVHLFEEDLTRMHEIAPQSARARAFRRLNTFVKARGLSQPRAAVVISEAELAGVRRRYPAARPVTLPYVMPSGAWPLADTPSGGDVVLVVGTLKEERHAVGLAEALQALVGKRPPDLRVRLISGAGLHPSLRPYLDLEWVEAAGHVDELRPHYRAARMVLVPAKRATGMKTTILQGWVSGCPVVAYAGSAATLATHAHAMLVAEDGAGIARHIAAAWDDAALRERLVRSGREVMATSFDAERVVDAFLGLVADTAARG